jgi:hypothetical protein
MAFELPFHQRQLFKGFLRDLHDAGAQDPTKGVFVAEDSIERFRCTWQLDFEGIKVR